jgi:O-glycosyl hydrolase
MFLIPFYLSAQDAAYAEVDFNRTLQPWDGFGVNYVETAQTKDYQKWQQDYGGFSLLSESQRQEILQMIFGEDGLKPGIIKMFLDPFHEGMTQKGNDNESPFVLNQDGFDHETTTEWLRYFARNGHEITQNRGGDLTIFTTMYGPPPWVTEQEVIMGRDLDPAMKYEMAEYMIAWVDYLKKKEQLPVKYLSLHNEGDRPGRWNEEGTEFTGGPLDYNMHWPPEQVVNYLELMPEMLAHFGHSDVGIAPGETVNWKFFSILGYAPAIIESDLAFDNIDLITSHSFWNPAPPGVGLLRWRDLDLERGRYLHAWTTSMSWRDMDVDFINQFYSDIYQVGVNAITPWAVIQTDDWLEGDPNPGTAFRVEGKKEYTVLPGYYFYKQMTRAGQPGMQVAHTYSSDQDIVVMAFASGETDNPNAFVILNRDESSKDLEIRLRNSDADTFSAYRSSPDENYEDIGEVKVKRRILGYDAPARSVTTFFSN